MNHTHHKRSAVRDLAMLLILMLTGWLLALIIEIAQIQEANAASAEMPVTATICVMPSETDPRWQIEVMTGCNYACPSVQDQCVAESVALTEPAAGQQEIDWTIKGDME